jgi:putative Mn2+ efflux pump MntP
LGCGAKRVGKAGAYFVSSCAIMTSFQQFGVGAGMASFLANHHEAIAAMDFFTVPSLTFGVIYCFFVISHDRRRILHCNATMQPTSVCVSQ